MPRHTHAEQAARKLQAGMQRQATRSEQMRRRLAEAKTLEAEMSMAFDWARSSIRRTAKKGVTRTGEQRNKPAADRAMRMVIRSLVMVAAALDDGRDPATESDAA
jgi:hypothetical protein